MDKFAIALGLGLLVGLQRQHSDSTFAGLRTFPLITLFGFLCGLLSPWLAAAGLIAAGSLIALSHWANARSAKGSAWRSAPNPEILDADQVLRGPRRSSLVTESALLAMYAIGALISSGDHILVAVAAATTIAVLLEFKVELHGFVAKLGEADIKAILQFALISLVILPVLPDRTFGPYDVLNPRQIWWMVVLIVGINLAGYLAYRFVSPEKSLLLSGVLGGLISSTATTASYARKGGPGALVVILVAGCTVYFRLAAEVLTTAPQIAMEVLPRLALPLTGLAAFAFWHFRTAQDTAPQETIANPAEMRVALVFALGYAVVLLANAAAKDHLGDSGVLGLAIAGGLTDVDAITLSTTQMVNAGRVSAEVAWRSILIASLSNLAFKCGVAFVLGGRRFGSQVGAATVCALVLGSIAFAIGRH
jgi:uncharacterized membrane protein (DUF4010 family)